MKGPDSTKLASNSNNYSIGNHFFKVLVQIHYSLVCWFVNPYEMFAQYAPFCGLMWAQPTLKGPLGPGPTCG